MPRKPSREVMRQRQGLARAIAMQAPLGPVAADVRSTSPRAPRWQDRISRKAQAEQLRREPTCRVCREQGVETPATEVDHIRPRSEGGAMTDPANLRSLCWEHARQKDVEDRARRTDRPVRRRRKVRIDPTTGYPLPSEPHWWAEPLPGKGK